MELASRYLPKSPVIVEAGAEHGGDTLRMSKRWPHAQIHAFEPVPALFAQLKSRVKSCSNVSCYQCCLSDTCGIATFHVSEGGSSSLAEPNRCVTDVIDFNEDITVKTYTLDAWARRYNVEKIDFLWLDLQGLEPRVLEASSDILDNVRVICTEVSLKELYAGTKLYPEFKLWLETRGFVAIHEKMYYPTHGDVIFVRNDLLT